MQGWFFFIILYLLFAAIGPIVKQFKRRQRLAQQQGKTSNDRRRPQQNVQAKFEQYFEKIEEALTQKQPPSIPNQQAGQESRLFSIPPRQQSGVEEEISPVETPTHRLLAEKPVELEFRPLSSKKMKRTSASLLSFNRRRGYMHGIILAEILGPPVSKRQNRRKPL